MRIGVYVRNLDEEYHLTVYSGIRDRAREYGMDVVCFQGESVDRNRDSGLPLFPLNEHVPVDGAIMLTATMIERNRAGDAERLADAFARTPVVAIGNTLSGFPTILAKTRAPMRELMDHLIDRHGYRRFLYVGGPEGNRDNRVRESVFRRALEDAEARGERVTGTVVTGGLFFESTGFTALKDYVADHPERDVDAIVAASDNIAIGALRVIRAYRDSSWNSCPITGFDDIPRARAETPPLTTIRQPLREMGALAVDTLRELMDGKRVPAVRRVPAVFVPRRSCGCPDMASADAASDGTESDADVALPTAPGDGEGVPAWHLLRDVNSLGQQLSQAASLEEVFAPLERFLVNSRTASLRMLVFSRPSRELPPTGRIVFSWKRFSVDVPAVPRSNVSLSRFFSSALAKRGKRATTRVIYPLKAGDEYLGLIVYEASDSDYPYLCSCGTFLSNAMKRMQVLEDEKERARQLELEVARRTDDLTKANARLRREAARREAVEREVLRISDLERMRFSMELHDDICQRLAGIAMICKGLSAGDVRLQEVTAIAVETLQKTREYAQNSFPVTLGAMGLNDALRQLCETMNRQSGIRIRYEWSAGKASPFTPAQELNVYRIAQEALHNVARHSLATEARVSVTAERGGHAVTIRDNGTGTAELGTRNSRGERERAATGLGMRSMEYRAHQLGARFTVTSSKAAGTEIRAFIPE